MPEERADRFALGLAAAGVIRARMRGDLAGAEQPRRAAARHRRGPRPAQRSGCSTSGSRGSGPDALEAAARDLESARRAAETGGRDWLALVAVASLAAHAVVTGRLERARRLAGETLALAGERGWVRTWPVGLAEAALSGVALERNRREDALAHFRRADELLTHASDVPLRMAMMMQRARLAVAEGRPEPALEALERAAELSEGWPVMPAMRGLAAGLQAISRAALGGPAAAEALLRNGAGQPATSEQAAALARLRLLAGDPAGAHAALAPWLDRAADARPDGRRAVAARGARARRRRDARAGRRGARAGARRGRAARDPAPVRRARRARRDAAAAPAAPGHLAPVARRDAAAASWPAPRRTRGRARCWSSRSPTGKLRSCASCPR